MLVPSHFSVMFWFSAKHSLSLRYVFQGRSDLFKCNTRCNRDALRKAGKLSSCGFRRTSHTRLFFVFFLQHLSYHLVATACQVSCPAMGADEGRQSPQHSSQTATLYLSFPYRHSAEMCYNTQSNPKTISYSPKPDYEIPCLSLILKQHSLSDDWIMKWEQTSLSCP